MAMSQSTLYRRLKEYTGMGANEYIRRHRLALGMQLLREGYNVSEVSDRCGFSTPQYFSRCFREEYGQLPSEI
jgi:AraC-like DNA-binding protein